MNLPRLLLRLLLGRRLPRTQGSLRVPGVHGQLSIHRDRWGIPYLEADNELDAYFGIGFCHGQDRTFQLEILLRVVRGTLCELVGRAALPVDQLSRRIGFHHSAREQWPILDAKVRAMIEAYAQGVAAGATHGLPRRPHEFVLLRSQPTPWTPLDSLGLVKLISFTLATNWDIELARLKVLLEDGPEALAALNPAYPPWLPATAPPGKEAGPALDRLAEELKAFTAVTGLGGGSNSWTLAANRTATGRPLLANDPHLDSRLPPHWYLIQARTPQWSVAGATFLGGPAVQAGHNGHAAWGVTAGLIDNTDLFREQIGPDGRSVRQGEGYVPCEVREEVIAIRREASVTEQVLITPRGPIISPALRDVSEALSLRAVWLDPHPLDGLLHLHRVRSFEEFRQAAEHWPAASWNMVYADQTNTIGWQMFGQAPKRRKGWGLIPAPGWDAEFGWESELVSAEELPHVVNPPEGFVATANNQPLPDGVGPFLGMDWLDGYRAASIARELNARADWDVPRTLALQMNQHAVAWDDLRGAVLSAPAGDADVRQALEMLRGWDGRVSVDSPAATVYELFLSEMEGRVARAKAPRSFAYVLGEPLGPITSFNFLCYRRTGHLARLLREQPAGWFPHSWSDEIADALATVVQELRTKHGGDPAGWAFGRLRTLILHHPLSRKRWLASLFNLGPIPFGGDADTINQGAVLPLDPLASVDNIASLRVVIDVGAWSNSRFSLPGGQSGNPLSPHYDDLFLLWQRGEGVPIAWTEEEIRQAAVETLTLMPE
ncbi:MAG TPA: penicillin acylase family protein [Gemmataceae bacterium]|nr:penicillin acylase family protein [Gemmataceae bacterium]